MQFDVESCSEKLSACTELTLISFPLQTTLMCLYYSERFNHTRITVAKHLFTSGSTVLVS